MPILRSCASAAGNRKSTAVRSGKKWFRIGRSSIEGRGGFATRLVPRGTRIVEYTGERISHEEADARYDDESMSRHHTLLFTVNRKVVVDAAVGGNEARFINHSCQPNCDIEIVRGRIYIDARRDILPDEELSYDYAYERDENDDKRTEKLYICRCGARLCRGTILRPRSNRRK